MDFKFTTRGIFFFVLLLSAISILGCGSTIEISEKLTAQTFNYPVLKGKENNPVLRIQLQNEGEGEIVRTIQLSIGKTEPQNLRNIKVYYTKKDSLFNDQILFGTLEMPSKGLGITGNQALEKGMNYFWVSYQLADNADLTDKVYANFDYITIGNKDLAPIQPGKTKGLRLGTAVRKHNDDKVHTYRIPGLTTTKEGTLLAVYDVRRDSGRDLQGDMDIGVSRSVDGGETWEPMRIAMDMGEWGGLPQKFNGVSDANILVDDRTGTIFIAALWMHGVIDDEGVWQEDLTQESDVWNHQWRTKGSQPGFDVKQSSQFLIVKSTDDGKTWSDPINRWNLPTIEIDEVESVSQDPDYLIIDVRDKERYEGKNEPIDLIAGHIPGAINIPFTENLDAGGLFLTPERLREKYEPVFREIKTENSIVHCGSGVTACHTLLALDYAEMEIPKLYVGSWSEWSRNNKKIERTGA